MRSRGTLVGMPSTRASTLPLGLDSDITVSALGFGCWAIGGTFTTPDRAAAGWGAVDDAQSIAAIRRGHGAAAWRRPGARERRPVARRPTG